MEEKVGQQDGNKSPQERREIQGGEINSVHQANAQGKRNTAVEKNRSFHQGPNMVYDDGDYPIRRMTGTEDGMLSLIGKSLAALRGKENLNLISTDDLIPIEPSLATEGMLWFDNLMIPDSTCILPFALSGIMYVRCSCRARIITSLPAAWVMLAASNRLKPFDLLHTLKYLLKYLKYAPLAIAPATVMFPSAMLLYWFSNVFATILLLSYRHVLWTMLRRIVRTSPATNKPDEDKKQSKPPTEKYYPPTRKQIKKQKTNQK